MQDGKIGIWDGQVDFGLCLVLRRLFCVFVLLFVFDVPFGGDEDATSFF